MTRKETIPMILRERLTGLKYTNILMVIIAMVLLSGCITTDQSLRVDISPARPLTEGTQNKYLLGGDDVISVTTERHPEFTGVVIITRSGRPSFPDKTDPTFMTLPFWKEIQLTGISEDRLEQEITEKLKKYLYEPQVTVSIVQYGSKKYYVVGEVLKPGRYAMKGGSTTLMEAIFEAGLPTPYASLRRARIIVPGSKKAISKKVNLYTLIYKGDLKQNLTLEPGDIVYVPSTIASKWNTLLDQILNPASKASSLQQLYHQFDTDYYRNLYKYNKWYYITRPGYSR